MEPLGEGRGTEECLNLYGIHWFLHRRKNTFFSSFFSRHLIKKYINWCVCVCTRVCKNTGLSGVEEASAFWSTGCADFWLEPALGHCRATDASERWRWQLSPQGEVCVD